MKPDDLPSVGDTLVGKYQLTRKLGQGGMGAVFEATHLKLGQRVAIKLVLPQLAQRPELAYRFEQEGRAAAKLRGRHTARVSDVDVTPEGLPFLVMEFLEGHSLLDELKRRGPLPIGEAVHYVREACEGVEEAHRAGIIHRDLKPANLFLSVEGTSRVTKVVDFGIAKMSETGDEGYRTATNVALGTYKYMSPEQAKSARTVDARTDVWSLGVVLYQLLADKLPFQGEGDFGIMYAITTQATPPLRNARPDVPEALVAIVEQALSKRREDRYQTVGDLAHALAPFDSKPNAPWPRPFAPLLTPAALPPSLERTASKPPPPPRHLPSDDVPNESVTSGSKSHVVPIGLAAPSQGVLIVPRWFVGSCVALLFGASIVIGIGLGATDLHARATALTPFTLSSAAAFQGLSASATTAQPSPPTASAPIEPPLAAALADKPPPRPTDRTPVADGVGDSRAAAGAAGAPSPSTPLAATTPRVGRVRPSNATSEPTAHEASAGPPKPPPPEVLSEGEIFD
jgi:eukaryotic-like serine/threonine-protein kinase